MMLIPQRKKNLVTDARLPAVAAPAEEGMNTDKIQVIATNCTNWHELGTNYRSYFQFRPLPSAIHSMEVAMRLVRVVSVFASVIQVR